MQYERLCFPIFWHHISSHFLASHFLHFWKEPLPSFDEEFEMIQWDNMEVLSWMNWTTWNAARSIDDEQEVIEIDNIGEAIEIDNTTDDNSREVIEINDDWNESNYSEQEPMLTKETYYGRTNAIATKVS